MKPIIKEKEVTVTLSYASANRYRSLGYEFPKDWVREKKLVKVKVEDLTYKSTAKVTRICPQCGTENRMTMHKANINPVCHSCVTKSVEFKRATGIGTQKGRVKNGDKSNYRTIYKHHYGEVPSNWDVHHIDMDRSNDDIENLIAMPKNTHRKCHQSLNKLCKILLEQNVIKFNKDTLSYEIVND